MCDTDFICTGKVSGIKMDMDGAIVSCSNCTKKLQRTVSSFIFVQCNNTNAVGVLRYVPSVNTLSTFIEQDVYINCEP